METQILTRLMDVEQWKEVHTRLCEIERGAMRDQIDLAHAKLDRLEKRHEQFVNRIVLAIFGGGGTLIVGLATALWWFMSDKFDGLRKMGAALVTLTGG